VPGPSASEQSTAPRGRRRRVLVSGLVVAVVLVTVVVAVVAWVRRAPTGGSVAEGSDAFRRCWELSTAGQDDLLAPTGTETWDAEAERRFWSQPPALDCAVERFEEPVRARALQEAFPSRDDGADVQAQWQAVADYATWLTVEQGADSAQVLLRAGAVLTALWVAEDDTSSYAEAFVDVVVLADMSARGELPGYRPWLQGTDRTDDARALADYLDDDLVADRPENDEPYRLSRDRADALLYAIR
jgi:hypothetical protein